MVAPVATAPVDRTTVEVRRLRRVGFGLGGALLFVAGLATGLLLAPRNAADTGSVSPTGSPVAEAPSPGPSTGAAAGPSTQPSTQPSAGGPSASGPSASGPSASGPTSAPTALPPPIVPIISLPQSGVAIGAPTAPLTLEIWADFQCPYCGVFALQVGPWLEKNYIAPGKIRLVHRDLAFLGAESLDAAVVARYAATKGKFWELHSVLYQAQNGENKGAFARPKLIELAGLVGLDATAVKAALDDPALIAAVQADNDEGAKFGIKSTPTLRYPDGTISSGVPASASEFSATLEAALKKVAK
jgi:protein-disulfide isomerase